MKILSANKSGREQMLNKLQYTVYFHYKNTYHYENSKYLFTYYTSTVAPHKAQAYCNNYNKDIAYSGCMNHHSFSEQSLNSMYKVHELIFFLALIPLDIGTMIIYTP